MARSRPSDEEKGEMRERYPVPVGATDTSRSSPRDRVPESRVIFKTRPNRLAGGFGGARLGTCALQMRAGDPWGMGAMREINQIFSGV